MELASEYRVQLSFDDHELSAYIITLQRSFANPEEAIIFLIKDYPLEFKQIGEVYTIYRTHPAAPIKNYRLSGRVIDSKTSETLPYSHVLINQSGVICDFNGNFSYVSTDSLFNLTISYLGYYIKDTTLAPGVEYVLELTPSIIGLEEVVVEGSMVERSGQTGEEAGTIRLNHKIAYRLPGNGDNAVFNFLRLQPGILAAGERSSELIIWGSYSGHSKIMFDGFTIFGLKNFNDNISFVNPYLAKDIKVLKGGFSSEYDNRVGGIVDISGINGSTQKPSINLNINNMTANGMASIPIAKRSAITFAYRQTYYNLYDAEDLHIITRSIRRGNSGQTDVNVYPDYVFRDMNLKYAGTFKSGDTYFISLYEGRDKFSYEFDQERNNAQIDQEAEEGNIQRGATAFFGKTWKKGWNSHFSFSASGLEREVYEKQLITRNSGNWTISDKEVNYYNSILDLSLKNKNMIPLTEKQTLEAGWNYTYEGTHFGEGEQEDSLEISEEGSHRISLYIQDEIRLTPGFSVKPGIRTDYSFFLEKAYIQPRIQASLDLSDHWRVNAAAGIYRQFISETSVIDELGNFRYFWSLCDNVAVPVLKAVHLVGGVNYHTTGLSAGVEGFYKTTEGISRYRWIDGTLEVAQGNARTYGMDV
ncbi:MAG: carboxypeptidase-like regulatory domain-containing protein, partial [Bacteroidota bacterium]|nr:carboxypeptidase-like regulatory domain-containing protein [Bacteroidota bacterium]